MDTAQQIARDGLAGHYHPSVLAGAWRRAKPEHWARLALLARCLPEDGRDRLLHATVIDQLEALGRHPPEPPR